MSTRILTTGSTVTVEINPDVLPAIRALKRLTVALRLREAAREAARQARMAARTARWSEYHRRQKRRNR